MRMAAIDIGTNSVKLLVADADPEGALTVVTEQAEVTRLGAGVDKTGRLSEDACARTLDAVTRFARDAHGQGAHMVLAAGTSALRDAANGAGFLARVKAQASIDIQIITGEREAELAFAAVRSDPSLLLPERGPISAFDIGGGSTELILGDRHSVQSHVSLQIGAVRVTERHLHTDPPTMDELDTARADIRAALQAFPAPNAGSFVAGLGGTAVNVASVMWKRTGRDAPETLHGVVVTRDGVQETLQWFTRLPLEQRKAIPGLEPARADVIVGGALVLEELLAHLGAAQFTVSVRGLRFGLLAEAARPA